MTPHALPRPDEVSDELERLRAEVEEKHNKRDTEMGRLRGQIKRERAMGRMAKRHAMDCDARQAEAEAAQARAEARHTKLKATHLRAAAEHEHELDTLTDRVEQAEAERDVLRATLGQLRADCEAVAAEGFIADDNPAIWVDGARAYAKRVLALLNAGAAESEPSRAAQAFIAWIEEVGYHSETPGSES